MTDYKIIQIIPADGWYGCYLKSYAEGNLKAIEANLSIKISGEVYTASKLVAWALALEDDEGPYVIGLIAPSDTRFVRPGEEVDFYAHESEFEKDLESKGA